MVENYRVERQTERGKDTGKYRMAAPSKIRHGLYTNKLMRLKTLYFSDHHWWKELNSKLQFILSFEKLCELNTLVLLKRLLNSALQNRRSRNNIKYPLITMDGWGREIMDVSMNESIINNWSINNCIVDINSHLKSIWMNKLNLTHQCVISGGISFVYNLHPHPWHLN